MWQNSRNANSKQADLHTSAISEEKMQIHFPSIEANLILFAFSSTR
jgi:hypothetical protein